MGKVSKRLNIIVTDPAMLEWPEIKKLIEQGHAVHDLEYPNNVRGYPNVPTPVFYLGPTAWRMNDKLKRYLPLAIKAMRAIAYPKEGDREQENDSATSSPNTAHTSDEADGVETGGEGR